MYKIISVIILAIGLVTGRQINSAGLNLVKEFEGFRPNFYLDSVGIKTIGYGHACHVSDCSKIKAPISVATGESILRSDLATHESCVQGQVPFVNDNQFAALVSFSFNLGCGALKGSTLLKYVKAKKYADAANEFGKWVNAGGKPLPGLVRRRAAEKKLFLA